MEEWRDIEGYEGAYQVSSEGRVRSLDRVVASGRRWKGRIRKLVLMDMGRGSKYMTVILSGAAKPKCAIVHKLVLEAFNCKKPEGCEARHLDGDTTNNSDDNLRWGTPLENAADKAVHGTRAKGETHGMAKLTAAAAPQIKALAAQGVRQRDIGELFGVSQAHVSRIVRGEQWAA